MNETPKETADDSPQGRFNSVMVVFLVVVGVLGSAAMLYQQYGLSDQPRPANAPPPREASAEPARPASPVAPRIASGFALRLPAFSDVATAEDLRARLGAQQIPSSISVEAKVQVGPFKSREEAEAARAKLKELGIYGGELVTIKQEKS